MPAVMNRNVTRIAVVQGPNPVHGTADPHLELPETLTALEVGVMNVIGVDMRPIVADADYVLDYSGPAPDGSGKRVYRGLGDVLDDEALAHTRVCVVRLLEAMLADSESWFLFVLGELDSSLPRPAASFTGRVDSIDLGGSFTILEVAPGELGDYAVLFGACDRVSGLAAPAGSLSSLLAQLSLAAAVPTGQRYRFASPFHQHDSAALARVLGHGRLFFEETDNGTRLRMIMPAQASAAVRERLTLAIEGSTAGEGDSAF
jgi:hypothetical protein